MPNIDANLLKNSQAPRQCLLVTCFSDNQPGFLDFAYRVHSLAAHYKVTLLSQDPLRQPEFALPGTTNVPMGRQGGKYGWLNYLRRCAAYIRRSKPDLVVLLHSSASPITFLIGRIPTILYWNEHPTNLVHLPEGFSPIRNALAIACHKLVFLGARHATLVMPIGEEHRDDLVAHGCKPDRVKLTYMGVADSFSGAAVHEASDTAPIELIYIGTVSAPRGRDVMLDGIAASMRQGHNINLTIVGADDEQLAYCHQKIRILGIAEHVKLKGRVPGSEIPALLAKADLGICLWEDKPWWRFNPPTKLFEYLVSGLPVLASDIRTHTRYVQSWENGLIFEYSATGFSNAIGAIFSNRSKLIEMKSNALRTSQGYLWSKIEPVFLDRVSSVLHT